MKTALLHAPKVRAARAPLKEKAFPMDKRLFMHMARATIARVGGVDAACAAIEAEYGEPVSRGTISKIQNGHLDITFAQVVALQKATGDIAFANFLRRANEHCGAVPAVTHVHTLKEATEAVMAQAEAEQSGDADSQLRAVKETLEAVDIMRDWLAGKAASLKTGTTA
ncbi:hypothetical protein NHU_00058 [Rhodovulum sulfidophilum]|uniref:Uncharacterized protein n=1 Tax=Rhodovulum sulfidophilum TaxID=35806 RepID=A0A0D6AXA3_RHOSU|nr:hypothetical protein [Rhodovulum sulfidophilum]BAQ67230.1 hypothetical protein NHU_00058 [Rhodovulum sulfidophilum]